MSTHRDRVGASRATPRKRLPDTSYAFKLSLLKLARNNFCEKPTRATLAKSAAKLGNLNAKSLKVFLSILKKSDIEDLALAEKRLETGYAEKLQQLRVARSTFKEKPTPRQLFIRAAEQSGRTYACFKRFWPVLRKPHRYALRLKSRAVTLQKRNDAIRSGHRRASERTYAKNLSAIHEARSIFSGKPTYQQVAGIAASALAVSENWIKQFMLTKLRDGDKKLLNVHWDLPAYSPFRGGQCASVEIMGQ